MAKKVRTRADWKVELMAPSPTGPASTASRTPMRFRGRKRGPALATGPGPPQPGSRAAAEPQSRGPCVCLAMRSQGQAPACLRGTRAGVEHTRRGDDFFPRLTEGREEPVGGGEWWEPKGVSGLQGAAGVGRTQGPRAPGRFPELLGAGSAARRRAGMWPELACWRSRPPPKALLSSACARAGWCSNGGLRRD